jgi:hypothetical protein
VCAGPPPPPDSGETHYSLRRTQAKGADAPPGA